jgi:hypothetical protein
MCVCLCACVFSCVYMSMCVHMLYAHVVACVYQSRSGSERGVGGTEGRGQREGLGGCQNVWRGRGSPMRSPSIVSTCVWEYV